MHGINLSLTSHFYVDASGFGAGLAITQVNQVEGSPKGIEVQLFMIRLRSHGHKRNTPLTKEGYAPLANLPSNTITSARTQTYQR